MFVIRYLYRRWTKQETRIYAPFYSSELCSIEAQHSEMPKKRQWLSRQSEISYHYNGYDPDELSIWHCVLSAAQEYVALKYFRKRPMWLHHSFMSYDSQKYSKAVLRRIFCLLLTNWNYFLYGGTGKYIIAISSYDCRTQCIFSDREMAFCLKIIYRNWSRKVLKTSLSIIVMKSTRRCSISSCHSVSYICPQTYVFVN